MSPVDAFFLAFAITLVGTFLVTWHLHRPLKRLLPDVCGSAERAAFWLAAIDVILMLVPLMALFAGRHSASKMTPLDGLDVADLLWPPMLGLVMAVLLIAVIVGVLSNQEPMWEGKVVPRESREDLRRLLAKVDSVRTREILVRDDAGDGTPN